MKGRFYQLKINNLIPLRFWAESDEQAKEMSIKFVKKEGGGGHRIELRKAKQ